MNLVWQQWVLVSMYLLVIFMAPMMVGEERPTRSAKFATVEAIIAAIFIALIVTI